MAHDAALVTGVRQVRDDVALLVGLDDIFGSEMFN
jgi:hypothetical protein